MIICFNDTATTEIYTLSLHDALPISVQKIFYLPEAHTDFILAVIGEELGVIGVTGLLFLYGLIAYAGLRTARRRSEEHTSELQSRQYLVCPLLLEKKYA